MTKSIASYTCQSCGYVSAKWLGRCPDCGSWNSLVEERRIAAPGDKSRVRREKVEATPLGAVSAEDAPRVVTSNAEFNRVLGGGVVPGSLVLLGGEPGVGKSTLLLQVAQGLQEAGRRVLYVSGEESAQQIKMRADRLEKGGAAGAADIYVLPESNLERILAAAEDVRPTDLIIDSVQTTYSDTLDSTPGSISQVRHVAGQLLNLAKSEGITVFLIGHVTKDGSLAGPKALEHIVDAVLYFEGERHHNHRIVRAVKNRFGAANEVGIFEMTAAGLMPVRNPSNLFLSESGATSPGSAVCCALEGTRPILVEIQALVVATQYGTARRTATGVEYNRVSVLVAMMEKRLGIPMAGCDIYINAAGGIEVDEPAADLAVFAAVMSSFRNRAVTPRTVLLGELGLSGEARPVSQVHLRLREAATMGFEACVLPAGNLPLLENVQGVELLPVRTVSDLSDLIFRT
ncbi:MAG: DNA repair protein RadA [Acidobacteria bacterium]|nr:DNA repair protein RadA [Acidobacteriota bacterium]